MKKPVEIPVLEVKKLPFVHINKKNLHLWEKMGLPDPKYASGFPPSAPRTEFVDVGDLRQIARVLIDNKARGDEKNSICHPNNSVWAGTPGFMCATWFPQYSKVDKPYDYRFATGSYGHDLNDLSFMDDVFKWAHRQIKDTEVRSARDIVWQMAGNTGLYPDKYGWARW